MSGFTQTPHYNLYKPTFNADNDQWGDHWNSNADTLDSVLFTATGGATGPFLPLSGGTVTGIATFTVSPNVTAASGYSQFGQPILTTNNLANGSTWVGIGAGANGIANNDVWMTAVGWGAAQLAGGSMENTAVGTRAMNALTPGFGANTAVGVAAFMLDNNGVGNTAIGNDAFRNTHNAQSDVGVGWYSMAAGSPRNNTAVGTNAQTGNSLSVIVGGVATAGDVLQLTFTGAFTGSPRMVSYTVGAGNTTTQMASGLVNAINADAVLLAIPGRFVAVANVPANNAFGIQFDGTSTLGIAVTGVGNVTGAATETLTIGGGNLSQNMIAIGQNAMTGLTLTTSSSCVGIGTGTLCGLTTGANNIAIGRFAGQIITSASVNIAIGDSALAKTTTGSNNIAIGQNAGTVNDTGFNNVIIGNLSGQAGNTVGFKNNVLVGQNAGQSITTGSANTILGAMITAGSLAQITTGTNNVTIGSSAAVASPTAVGQLSIQNAIYGTSNASTDASVSQGKIGIYNRAPTALLTIGDNTNGAHIAVVATAPPGTTGGTIDARASDICGTVTGGTSSTGITITFEVQYLATIPHAVVTARDGVAFTYTVSQSQIVISHTAATGRIFDYMVIQ